MVKNVNLHRLVQPTAGFKENIGNSGWYLTTITTGPGFLGKFVRLSLKTCSLYHEKLFIQVVNDISSQVFNNFFSASRCKSDMHFFELQVETKKKLKT